MNILHINCSILNFLFKEKMKIMKKNLAIFIALVMMLSSVACGNKNDTNTPSEPSTSTSTSETTKPETPETPVATENLSLKFQNAINNAYSSEALKETIEVDPVVSGSTVAIHQYLVSLETATSTNIDTNKVFLTEGAKLYKSFAEQPLFTQEAPENPTDDDKAYFKELAEQKEAFVNTAKLLEELATKSGDVNLELTDEQKAQLKLANETFKSQSLSNIEMLFSTFMDSNGKAINPAVDLNAFAISMSMMNTRAHSVMILKPADGKEDFVYSVVENVVKNTQKSFEQYLQDQYEIAKNAKLEKLADGTIVLVMTESGEEVYNNIMEALK